MRKTQGDLEGMDVAWIAVDALGQVALFTTGGQGPIPTTALASIELAEDEACSLPETGGYELLVDVPRPDDFIAFAKRGLFAYDWSDVHRIASRASGRYELQARPLVPLMLSDLPARMQLVAAATRLSGVSFGAFGIQVDANSATWQANRLHRKEE
jgi:hypothetical protein